MNVRLFVVAASAVAILAGSSFGALAGYHKKAFSKGESESSVVSVGTVIHYTPVAVTLQHQENSSFTNQSNGGAGAGAGTGGGALAVTAGSYAGGISGAAAWGSTSGSSSAGGN